MSRLPGRDPFHPLTRLVRILSLLSSAAPNWVNRDRVADEAGYHSVTLADRRDELRRELRHLTSLGWDIESDARDGGATSVLRLKGGDPRLATLLSDAEIAQLERAARAAGRDPGDLGLPDAGPAAPSLPVSVRDSQPVRLEGVLHALQHRCLLCVRYNDCDRTLEVDAVRQTGTGRWLVIARDGGAQKQFRIDRFQAMRVGAPGTASAPQPDGTVTDPLEIPDGTPVDAVVRTTTIHQHHVVRELGDPIQRRPVDDGACGDSVELTIPVTNRRLWRMRLYQLGTRVSLIGPPELRDEVRAELLGFVGGR